MAKKLLIASAVAAMLIQTTPSFALILLDEVMSRDVQQKTGVANLTPLQKAALEDWLNANFEVKSSKVERQAPEIMLSINIEGGRKLQLSDGTMWEVDPNDVVQSSVWITPFPIRIVPSDSTDYPFLLVNKTSGVSVKARKVVPGSEAERKQPSPPTMTSQPPTTQPTAPSQPSPTQPPAGQ
ncbi:MAG: hypothetical protein KF898_04455 [Parachlamydiales bacterium]|nr:hypothetical protein [Verrucomicrobiota bacterium]MBX3718880.1 hypothetical protein [Candidatus Acheromyda pituitae]